MSPEKCSKPHSFYMITQAADSYFSMSRKHNFKAKDWLRQKAGGLTVQEEIMLLASSTEK